MSAATLALTAVIGFTVGGSAMFLLMVCTVSGDKVVSGCTHEPHNAHMAIGICEHCGAVLAVLLGARNLPRWRICQAGARLIWRALKAPPAV